MLRRFLTTSLALALLAIGSQARADVITSFYNTGVDAAGVPLADGVLDPHYKITAGPITTGPFAVTPPTTAPSQWIPNPANAKWISPVSPAAGQQPNGTYNYDTSFTIASPLLASTASIVGKVAADDAIEDILINGVSTGLSFNFPVTFNGQGYNQLYSFAITKGFVQGLNTLTFKVRNIFAAQTGLLVQATATAFIPEPASMALLGIGLSGLLGFRRFRRRSA